MLYRGIVLRYQRLGQDPNRFPVLLKEAEMTAFLVDTTVAETVKATCEQLTPHLKDIEKSLLPLLLPSKGGAKEMNDFFANVAAGEGKKTDGPDGQGGIVAMAGNPWAWLGVIGWLTAGAIATCATIALSRPVAVQAPPVPAPIVIEHFRIPPATYYRQREGQMEAWEGDGAPESGNGRWVPTVCHEIKQGPENR